MSRVQTVALVGLPGSGKSTVGRELAARLGWRCIDLDDDVAAVQGRSPAEIFAAEGESAFRRHERRALLHAMAQGTPAVIACGGGAVVNADSRRALLESAQVVFLDAPDDVLLRRLGNGSARPLLGDDPSGGLARLRAAREEAYAQAPHRVVAEGSVEEVVARVMSALSLDGTSGATRGWAVEVGSGALGAIARHVPPAATRVALIADRAVSEPAERVVRILEAAGQQVFHIDVDGGEALKTWNAAGDVLARLAQGRLRRGDCVIALGGGTVGDLAGFVAATYLRGVAWINAPSTLLAMVDSAIGGKTGVNLPQGKNLAGAFWQPLAVIADTALLGSLPDRAFRSALAEVVKYAMIGSRDTADFVHNSLDRVVARDPDALDEAVLRCVAAKTAVVRDDERESGPRQVLNYGHTVAHALEAATGFSDVLTHGEAVAAGMRVAGRLSVSELHCPRADIAWQDALLDRCGLRETPRVDAGSVLERIEYDKKANASGVAWVLLRRRGEPSPGHQVGSDLVRDALHEVLHR